MSWFRVRIQPDGRDLVDIQSIFLTAIQEETTRLGSVPPGMALFVTADIAAVERHYYFTPATNTFAPEFLRVVRANPCEPPTGPIRFQAGDGATRQT